MKTNWDYTELADAYMKRPDYAPSAIDEMIRVAGVQKGDLVCDIGAGTGHLTKCLLQRGLQVVAVEPNEAMRRNGVKVTSGQSVTWVEGTGEQTLQKDQAFKLVTFGSSFNTTDRQAALQETHRILKPQSWFACMWNHRDLDDPIQREVENTIKHMVPEYSYGTRREDQTDVIDQSGLFGAVTKIEGTHTVTVLAVDYIEAWRSHATLARQAGQDFPLVVAAITEILKGKSQIQVAYTTRIWMAAAKLSH